jgi:NADPH:quinone reductase-like Zn-dependent oxidoreductase
MKAIVQEGYGSPEVFKLREIERPVVAGDQVLVKVGAASVNAVDWGLRLRLPHLIGTLLRVPRSRVRGFDVAGSVEAVGGKVTRFRSGDEVFGTGIGSFAEYVATSEDRLAPKPRSQTFEEAAAMPIAGVTALQGLRDTARVRPGQRVLVYGAGRSVSTILSRLLLAAMLSRTGGQRIKAIMARARREDLLVLKDLVEAGKLSPVIDRRYPLSEAPEALSYVGSGAARGKVIISVAG